MPQTVPNQKTIAINKEKCDKDHLYATINLEALQDAMIDLSGEALKLWLYMAKNQNGYTFALSPIDAVKWGIGSKSSYIRAVNKLIKEKYLIETSPNHSTFYEKSKKEKPTVTVEKAV